jgi:hypothetical protein
LKTATGLTLLAIGAVLAFAVHGHPWFLNLQVCGWIIMVIGLVGLVVPRRGYGWLRRQMVVRRGPDGRPRMAIRQKRYPPYIVMNPAAMEAGGSGQSVAPPSDDTETWVETDEAVPADAVPEEETVDEYFQE